MTATTVGLGDIAPHTQAGRAYAIFHMLLSVVLFANVISAVLVAFEMRASEAKKGKMLNWHLDESLITRLDRDGNGVDKAEFVLGMLELVGVISEADFKPFVAQFHELDTSGDGRLTREDMRSSMARLSIDNANPAEMARLAAASEAQSRLLELHACATHLMFPSGILCLSFLWHSSFGYTMLSAGLVNGLAIGATLGLPPSIGAYRLAASLASAGLLLQVSGCVRGRQTATFQSQASFEPR